MPIARPALLELRSSYCYNRCLREVNQTRKTKISPNCESQEELRQVIFGFSLLRLLLVGALPHRTPPSLFVATLEASEHGLLMSCDSVDCSDHEGCRTAKGA